MLGVRDVARATSLTPNTQSTLPHPGPPTYYNIRTIHHIAVTTVLRSGRWGNDCLKHAELIQRSIKLLLLHLVGNLYYSPSKKFLYFLACCTSARRKKHDYEINLLALSVYLCVRPFELFNYSQMSYLYAASYERTVGFHVKALFRLHTNAETAPEI